MTNNTFVAIPEYEVFAYLDDFIIAYKENELHLDF